MNVLILSGKFGMGHWAAAEALRERVLEQYPEAQVSLCDLWEEALSPDSARVLYRGFSLLVRYSPRIYNAVHRITEDMMTPAYLSTPFYPQLKRLLRDTSPEWIISTHPVCAQAVYYYKRRQGRSFVAATCVTDVTCHSEWIHPYTDFYMVPSDSVRDGFIEKGISPEHIWVTGIPVRQSFRQVQAVPPTPKRRLLIMGGGLGLIPRDPAFYAALSSLKDVETTVITGRNLRFAAYLCTHFPALRVHGYVTNVSDFMANSDLLLSKPGGITVFEAISAGLPIAAWEPFLEQEQHNADFLVDQRLGVVVPHDTAACLPALLSLLRDEERLSAMRRNMHGMSTEFDQNLNSLFLPVPAL